MRALMVAAFAGGCLMACGAEPPLEKAGGIELLLRDAVDRNPEAGGANLEMALWHGDGRIEPRAWAGGMAEYARAIEGSLQAGELRARVRVFLGGPLSHKGDYLRPVGLVREYAIEARVQPDGDGRKFVGRWSAKRDGQPHEGDLTGKLVAVPRPPEGFVPPAFGEHPRLLLRRGDIPALKRKAESAWGQRMLQRLKEENPYKSNMAAARGLLYVLTGERRYADEAQRLIEADLAERGWHLVGPIHDPARRAMEDCIAYDLIHDACGAQFRERFRAMMAERVSVLYHYNFVIRRNPSDASNWGALYRSGAGMVALTLLGEPGVAFPPPAQPELLRLAEPADLVVGEGVPVAPLESGKMWYDWLYAGPWKLDRGEDGLAALGGAASVRPQRGTQIAGYEGKPEGAFRPAPDCRIVSPHPPRLTWVKDAMLLLGGGAKHALAKAPVTTVYCYSVIDNDRPGYYRVRLNEYQLDNPCVFIAGRRFVRGDYLYLEKGRFPVMAWLPIVKAVTLNSHDRDSVAFWLSLDAVTEAAARQWIERKTAWYEAERDEYAWRKTRCERDGLPDPQAAFWLEAARRRVDAWIRLANGPYAFNSEGEAYNQHSFRCVLPLMHCYQQVRGVPLSPSVQAEQLLLGYAARTIFRDDGAALHTNTNGGGPLGVDSFARGFGTVPARFQPAVLWAWDHTQSLADAGKLGSRWLTVDKLDPLSAAMMFVNYPSQMQARDPGAVVPKAFADEQKGGYVFRNRWRDGDDLVATFLVNKPQEGARNSTYIGAFQVSGLGADWIVRGAEAIDGRGSNRLHIPGRMPEDSPAGKLVHYASQPDGSGCVVADLDEGYPGCRVRRSFAVDYSGKSGAAALLVVRDTVTGPQEQAVWQMVAEVDTEVLIADNTVALKAAGGATLRATVLRPKQAVIEAVEQEHAFEAQYLDVHRNTKFARKVIRFSGTNDFLVVMTLQKGDAPPVIPRDGGGCNVGKRTVRLDGDQIAFD